MKPRYLGDGVYASFDGHQIWLATGDDLSYPENKIALEPDVMESLISYYNDLHEPPPAKEEGDDYQICREEC